MKHPIASAIIAKLASVMDLEGARVTWVDGRVFVLCDGKWVKA